MATYARVENNTVIEIAQGVPSQIYAPAVAALFSVVPDGTLQNAKYITDHWVNPTPPPPPPSLYSVCTAFGFYQRFTVLERIAVKASTDPVVMEMWYTLNLAIQQQTNVDPNDPEVSGGVAYLAAKGGPGGDPIIAADRVVPILSGSS